MKKPKASYKFSEKELRSDLLAEARALRIHIGFAEIIVERVIKVVKSYLSTHPIVTSQDVEDLVYKELKKYNKDLAYIYHNRDKII